MPTQPINTPTKQQVRQYLQERVKTPKPVPDPQEIRRQLGWFLK